MRQMGWGLRKLKKTTEILEDYGLRAAAELGFELRLFDNNKVEQTKKREVDHGGVMGSTVRRPV
jgi:hypothetical protein